MIKNAIGRILGTDDHSLTGSVTQSSLIGSSKNDGDASTGSGTTRIKTVANGVTAVSLAMTTPANPSILVLVVTIKSSASEAYTWNIEEDGVILTTIGSSGTRYKVSVKIHVISSPTSGSNTYSVVANGVSQHEGVSISAVFIDVDDTHALGGSNNQKTVSSGIIK